MIDELLQDAREHMDKSVEATRTKFQSVRAGRASPSLLDRISVDYYGAITPLRQLATISAPEARLLTIQPYDKSSVKAIERAIMESDLGLTPNNDGSIIRLFVASGARLAEISNLRWTPGEPTTNDVDLDSLLIRVVGKGNRERPIWVGAKAAKALDRYIYDHRSKHRMADAPWLWLGPRGRLTASGIAQLVRTRGDPLVERIEEERDVFAAQLGNLAAAIRDGRPPLVPLADGLRTLEIVLAARRSADERREIRL